MFCSKICKLTVRVCGKISENVKKNILHIFSSTACSCGTTKGVLDGAGSVLEGLASDVRSVGDYLN